MPDFHHNIFYYYRGASQINTEFERQLEDNTTKALINTLEHCSKAVSKRFLNWLGINSNGKIHFELQRKSIGEAKISGKSKRLLLGLLPKDSLEYQNRTNKVTKEDSRPDAWIYGENFVVLIESKVVGNLDSIQMRNHLQKLKTSINQHVSREIRKWSDIHRFFVGILPELSDKNKWLVKQFIQYLEWINMADFTGFKPEIFDYFIAHDDEEIRKWVRDTMKKFAEKLQPKLYKLDPFYNSYDLGRLELKHPYSWIAFGPKDRKYRNWAHQTIVINSVGLEVLLNVELKNATDKLKRKVHHENNKFRKYLGSLELDEPLWIQIEERKQKQAMMYDYNLVAKIKVSSLRHGKIGSSSLKYLETLINRLPYPYFSIRKLIKRAHVCQLSQQDQGHSLTSELFHIFEKFHSIITFINN